MAFVQAGFDDDPEIVTGAKNDSGRHETCVRNDIDGRLGEAPPNRLQWDQQGVVDLADDDSRGGAKPLYKFNAVGWRQVDSQREFDHALHIQAIANIFNNAFEDLTGQGVEHHGDPVTDSQRENVDLVYGRVDRHHVQVDYVEDRCVPVHLVADRNRYRCNHPVERCHQPYTGQFFFCEIEFGFCLVHGSRSEVHLKRVQHSEQIWPRVRVLCGPGGRQRYQPGLRQVFNCAFQLCPCLVHRGGGEYDLELVEVVELVERRCELLFALCSLIEGGGKRIDICVDRRVDNLVGSGFHHVPCRVDKFQLSRRGCCGVLEGFVERVFRSDFDIPCTVDLNAWATGQARRRVTTDQNGVGGQVCPHPHDRLVPGRG